MVPPQSVSITAGSSFSKVSKSHQAEPDISEACKHLKQWSEDLVTRLQPFVEHYREVTVSGVTMAQASTFKGPRIGGLGLLRDLHDLLIMSQETNICWTVLYQAGRGLRDKQLEEFCRFAQSQTSRQIKRLQTRIKQAAPQTLVVPK